MSTSTSNYGLVKPALTDAADITALNKNWDKIDEQLKDNTVNITSTDGVTYTGTLDKITALYSGLEITIIPDKTSTSTSVKLNLNGLGVKNVKQGVTYVTAVALPPVNSSWLAANRPLKIIYDGTQWKTVSTRANANDFYGTLTPDHGGTGVQSLDELKNVMGVMDKPVLLHEIAVNQTHNATAGGSNAVVTELVSSTEFNSIRDSEYDEIIVSFDGTISAHGISSSDSVGYATISLYKASAKQTNTQLFYIEVGSKSDTTTYTANINHCVVLNRYIYRNSKGTESSLWYMRNGNSVSDGLTLGLYSGYVDATYSGTLRVYGKKAI